MSRISGSVRAIKEIGYQGPGDVVPGALGFWGLRAYSNATIGANAIRVRGNDTVEADFATISGGGLDLAALNSFQTTHGSPLTIAKLYDQVGTNHTTQSTAANQLTLILSGLGSLPVIRGGTATGMVGTNTITQAQPFTFSHFYKAPGSDGAIISQSGSDTVETRVDFVSANRLLLTAGANLHVTGVTDGVWHAAQCVFNSTNSDGNVDGVSTTGDTSTTGLTLALTFGSLSGGPGSGSYQGDITETGLWGSAFTGTQSTNISNNQHAFYGI